MRSKWGVALLLGAIGAALYVGNVFATSASPGDSFKGSTLAKATYGEIFSHVHTVPAYWQERIETKGTSDLYVQQNTWDPSKCGANIPPDQCIPSTGWHTHPGPSFVIVTQGSVTTYDGDDRRCTPHVYTAGTSNNAFVDPGDGHVHIIRDETGQIAQTIAVQLVAQGAVRRQDADDPHTCPF